MSKHAVGGGDVAGLLTRFRLLQDKAQARSGKLYPIVVIQEAGLDGFWIHRALEVNGIESHVVDPASIAVSRRHRRAKTDKIDGEALVRTLLAYKRGEARVCAMVTVPCQMREPAGPQMLRMLRRHMIGDKMERFSDATQKLIAQASGHHHASKRQLI